MVGERGFEPPTPWSRTRKQPFFGIRKNQELEEVENAAVTDCCFGADSSPLKTRRSPPTLPPSSVRISDAPLVVILPLPSLPHPAQDVRSSLHLANFGSVGIQPSSLI